MKKALILAAACLAASLAQAALPIPLDQLQLRVTYRPADAPGIGGVDSSMYNCRFFGGSVYATEINNYCWASFLRGSTIASAAAKDRQTRMVSPIPGTSYLLASGGTLIPFTRYDLDGTHPVDSASFPDGEKSESFDWVDNDTIVCTDYGANKQRLYLVDVAVTPTTLALTKNLTWNANGYVTTPVSTRIRNVRVGQTDTNFAYYGDNGVADNPKVYAIDLRSGASTELGHWDGTLRTGATASFGLWTVVERGGYLYLHTSDDGIQVYSMSGPTSMGAMVASYSPEELRPITPIAGGGNSPFYGFDVAPDGEGMILGDFVGDVFELQRRAPVQAGGWQLRAPLAPHTDLGLNGNSIYNPRSFDENIFAPQINDYCFGVYPEDSTIMSAGTTEEGRQTRMVSPFRGVYNSTYMLASGGGLNPYTRYNWDATNPQDAAFPDGQASESFDWVDDDTIICTDYTTKQRLYMVDVAVEPFALTKNTTWNANGYVTTPASTRIRNVRVGQTYSGYAYYGDAGQNTNPKFYAIELATGTSTELGSLGTLTGAGSFGLWTVVERGNYLYVQTTDNGIQVYGPMINATNKGPLYATYAKTELDALTSVKTIDQYYGMDLSADAGKMLLGAAFGNVYVLEPAFKLGIAMSGANVILSWPSYHTSAVIESSADLSLGFTEMSPQPSLGKSGNMNTAIIPASAPQFFRLRK